MESNEEGGLLPADREAIDERPALKQMLSEACRESAAASLDAAREAAQARLKQERSIRAGRFEIPREFLEEHPAAVQQLFARCIPVRAENRAMTGAIHYEAISPQFNMLHETSAGLDLPRYLPIFEHDGKGGPLQFVRFLIASEAAEPHVPDA